MGQPVDLEQFTEEHEGEVLPETAPIVENRVTAVVTEHFRWLTFAQLRGFTFYRDGAALGGTIVLHVGEEAASFENEWKRYSTQHHMAIYEHDADGTVCRDDKGNRVQIGLVSGAFSDMTRNEAWNAISELVTAEAFAAV